MTMPSSCDLLRRLLLRHIDVVFVLFFVGLMVSILELDKLQNQHIQEALLRYEREKARAIKMKKATLSSGEARKIPTIAAPDDIQERQIPRSNISLLRRLRPHVYNQTLNGSSTEFKLHSNLSVQIQRPSVPNNFLKVNVSSRSSNSRLQQIGDFPVGGLRFTYDLRNLPVYLKFRVKNLANHCSSKNPKQDPESINNVLLDRYYHVGFCSVLDASHTSWVAFLGLLQGYNVSLVTTLKKDLKELLQPLYAPPSEMQELKEATNDSLVILSVQHPLERLLFIYVICKYKTVPLFQASVNAGFLQDDIDLIRNHTSFSSFIDTILNTKLPCTRVWCPYTQLCAPCNIGYHAITKTETLWEDMEFLLKSGKWKPVGKSDIILNSKLSWVYYDFIHKNRHRYYATIDPERMKKVYTFYKNDFDFLGYSADEYLVIDKKEKAGNRKEETRKEKETEEEETQEKETDESTTIKKDPN